MIERLLNTPKLPFYALIAAFGVIFLIALAVSHIRGRRMTNGSRAVALGFPLGVMLFGAVNMILMPRAFDLIEHYIESYSEKRIVMGIMAGEAVIFALSIIIMIVLVRILLASLTGAAHRDSRSGVRAAERNKARSAGKTGRSKEGRSHIAADHEKIKSSLPAFPVFDEKAESEASTSSHKKAESDVRVRPHKETRIKGGTTASHKETGNKGRPAASRGETGNKDGTASSETQKG